jgi:hypothetical protein
MIISKKKTNYKNTSSFKTKKKFILKGGSDRGVSLDLWKKNSEDYTEEEKNLIIKKYNSLPEELKYDYIRRIYLSRGRYIKEFAGFIPSFYELNEQYYELNSNIEEWRSICINDFYFSNEGKKIFTYRVKRFFSDKKNKLKSNIKLDLLFHLKVKEFEKSKTPIPKEIFFEMDEYLLSGKIIPMKYIPMEIVNYLETHSANGGEVVFQGSATKHNPGGSKKLVFARIISVSYTNPTERFIVKLPKETITINDFFRDIKKYYFNPVLCPSRHELDLFNIEYIVAFQYEFNFRDYRDLWISCKNLFNRSMSEASSENLEYLITCYLENYFRIIIFVPDSENITYTWLEIKIITEKFKKAIELGKIVLVVGLFNIMNFQLSDIKKIEDDYFYKEEDELDKLFREYENKKGDKLTNEEIEQFNLINYQKKKIYRTEILHKLRYVFRRYKEVVDIHDQEQ